ncbi:hypothetical protein MRX96_041317 [Rhipicephalus microplus]
MDLKNLGDFTNAAAAGAKVRATHSNIRKQRDVPKLTVLGVVLPVKDKDATREKDEKLYSIAKSALVVFYAHISFVVAQSSCEMCLNEVVLTKKNYEKLAKGINELLAISTTVAIVQLELSDPSKTKATDKCKNLHDPGPE